MSPLYRRSVLLPPGTRAASRAEASRAVSPTAYAAPLRTRPGAADERLERRSRMREVSWTMIYVGFLAYIFAITTYQFPIGQPAIGLALVGLFLQKEKFLFPGVIVGFIAFTVWCGLGIVHSRWPDVVLEEVVIQLKLGLILLAAINALRTRAQIRFFIVAWVVMYVLYPVRGTFVNYFVVGYTTFGRALWGMNIYGNPNDLAALTLLQLGLAAGLLVTDRKWVRRGAMVAIVLEVLLVMITQSRAGILGLAVFGMLAIAGSRRRLKSLVVTAIAGVVVALAAPPQVWERLGGLKNVTDTSNLEAVDPEGSAEERFAIWQTSWKITADHPVQGVGWGTYSLMNNVYAPLDGSRGRRLGVKDTHSTYFNTLAETGVPGFVIFMSLVLGSLLATDRVRRRCKGDLPLAAQQLYFLELSLIGFLVAGIFGSFAKLSFLYLIMGLMYALSRVCEADLRGLTAAAPTRLSTPAR